jgi:hypothetical protein
MLPKHWAIYTGESVTCPENIPQYLSISVNISKYGFKIASRMG